MSLESDILEAKLSLENWALETVQGTLFQISNNIIKESPVDTGRFRNNWLASKNRPRKGTLTQTDKSGNRAVSRAGRIVESLEAGDTFYLANNLPYARRLEFGSSNQAPSGVLRVNVERVRAALARS